MLPPPTTFDPYVHRPVTAPGMLVGKVRSSELLTLAERILGEQHARRAFEDHASAQQRPRWTRPSRQTARGCSSPSACWPSARRRLRADDAHLGAARLGHGAGRSGQPARRDQPCELRYNREVLTTTLENIAQAMSVVDVEMRLVAWNGRYQHLFDYPDGMLYVGRPVADLMRWNAQRGEMGPGDVERTSRAG